MITIERALFRVNGHHRIRQMRIDLTIVGLHNETLIHHRRTQVARTVTKHFISKEARAIAIVDDRTLDISDIIFRHRAGYVTTRQPAYLAHCRIVLGNHRIQSRVRVVGMGVAELEIAKLGMTVGSPTFWVRTQSADVGPAKRLSRPAQRFSLRLPHGNHHWAGYQRWRRIGARIDDVTAMLRLPLCIDERQPDTASRAPDVWLDRAIH